jgi:autotransporter translocation and assembly factor TamB
VKLTGTPTATATDGTVTGTIKLKSEPASVKIDTPTISLSQRTGNATVTLSGNPSASVKDSGKVTGTVKLKSESATVKIDTPTITLSSSSASATADLKVSGEVSLTAGSTSAPVKLSGGSAPVQLKAGSMNITVTSKGSVQVKECPTTAKLDSTQVDSTSTEDAQLDLKVAPKSDFLIYLRPKF